MEMFQDTEHPLSLSHPEGGGPTPTSGGKGQATMPKSFHAEDSTTASANGFYPCGDHMMYFDNNCQLSDEQFDDEIDNFFSEDIGAQGTAEYAVAKGTTDSSVLLAPVASVVTTDSVGLVRLVSSPVGPVDHAIAAAPFDSSVEEHFGQEGLGLSFASDSEEFSALFDSFADFCGEADLDLTFTSDSAEALASTESSAEYFGQADLDQSFASGSSEAPATFESFEDYFNQDFTKELSIAQQAGDQPAIGAHSNTVISGPFKEGLGVAIGLTLDEVISGKKNASFEKPKDPGDGGPALVTGKIPSKYGGYVECTPQIPTVSTNSQENDLAQAATTKAAFQTIHGLTLPIQSAPMPAVDDQLLTTGSKRKLDKTSIVDPNKLTYNPEEMERLIEAGEAIKSERLAEKIAIQQAKKAAPKQKISPGRKKKQQATPQLQHNVFQPQLSNGQDNVQFQQQQPQYQSSQFNPQLVGSHQAPQHHVQLSPQQQGPNQIAQHQHPMGLQASYQRMQLLMAQVQEQSNLISAQITQYGHPQMAVQQGHSQLHYPSQSPATGQQYPFQSTQFYQNNHQLPIMPHGVPTYQTPGPQGQSMQFGPAPHQPMTYSVQQQPQQQLQQIPGNLQGLMNVQPFNNPPPCSAGPAPKKQRKSRAKMVTKESPTYHPMYDGDLLDLNGA